jgi:hypothetical protein
MSEELTVVPIQNLIAKPKTTEELLALACDIDNGFVEVSYEEMTDLKELIAEKFDNVKRKIDLLEMGAKLEEHYEKLHADHKRSLRNRAEWLQGLVAFQMDKYGFKKIPGKEFCASLRPSYPSKIKCQPDSMLYQKFPDFIERKYSWKLPEIKARLKFDPNDPIREYVTIETKQNLNFGIKKEI